MTNTREKVGLGTFNPKPEPKRTEPKCRLYSSLVRFRLLYQGSSTTVLGFGFRVLRTEHPKEPILKSRAQSYPSSPDSSSPMAQGQRAHISPHCLSRSAQTHRNPIQSSMRCREQTAWCTTQASDAAATTNSERRQATASRETK